MTSNDLVDVCLVVPPFCIENNPPLGVSVLKSCLVDAGISCNIDYANIHFSFSVKENIFRDITKFGFSSFVGEYIFNEAAGILNSYSIENYLDDVFDNRLSNEQYSHLLSLIKNTKKIAITETKKTVDRVLKHKPKMVGCSAIFQQRNASLAILKEIKNQNPDIITFMGGYEVFGSSGIEILKNFDFVDFVYFGESDEIFAEVTQKYLSGNANNLPYGVLKNGQQYPACPPHRISQCLDNIPTPDYDDYFKVLYSDVGKYLQNNNTFDTLFLEGSRGCSWGQKNPCNFCGENNNHIKYRKKSPDRVLQEVDEIVNKYNPKRIFFTDNLMPHNWFSDVLPKLANKYSYTRFFTDVRASLRPRHLKLLKEAGFGALQPGIESLSTNQLALMNKGVKSIQNISFLKSCKQHKILPVWNYLIGIPGECYGDYRNPANLIPLLEHLAPPGDVHNIFFPKFCSYVMESDKYNLEVKPAAPFKYISFDDDCNNDTFTNNTAFIYDVINKKEDDVIKAEKKALKQAVEKWKNKFMKCGELLRLDLYVEDEIGHITDTRSCANVAKHQLSGDVLDVLLLCETPVSLCNISEKLPKLNKDDISSILKELIDKKLVIYRDDLYLSLVTTITREASEKLDFKAFCKSLR